MILIAMRCSCGPGLALTRRLQRLQQKRLKPGLCFFINTELFDVLFNCNRAVCSALVRLACIASACIGHRHQNRLEIWGGEALPVSKKFVLSWEINRFGWRQFGRDLRRGLAAPAYNILWAAESRVFLPIDCHGVPVDEKKKGVDVLHSSVGKLQPDSLQSLFAVMGLAPCVQAAC
eukprot:662975-Pelagomonas_calceolata.AAC.1